MLRKFKVPSTAITERGLIRLIKDEMREKEWSLSQWAISHGITPQAASAFFRHTQHAGLQIPEVFGYRPQIVYLPIDEDPINHATPPRRVAKRPSSKVDHRKPPVEKRGLKRNDRDETKKRLRARTR